jgi:hypothetical protein
MSFGDAVAKKLRSFNLNNALVQTYPDLDQMVSGIERLDSQSRRLECLFP